MNAQRLQQIYPKLIEHLEKNGYSKSYIERIKTEVRLILSKVDVQNWTSYKDVYLWHVQKAKSKAHLNEKCSILGTIERFEVHDQYPDGRQRKGIIDREKYPLLTS